MSERIECSLEVKPALRQLEKIQALLSAVYALPASEAVSRVKTLAKGVEKAFAGAPFLKAKWPEPSTIAITRKEFLKLPMKERRKILRRQAEKLLKAMPDYGKEEW